MARGSPAASEHSMDKNSDDDAYEQDNDPSPAPAAAGRPGRKKNPNSQAARRDQNRIAQREFRLRKQQRIRDLEARVELLSGNQDDTFNYMRGVLRELMAENHTLRGLVKTLSGFIGDGLPAFLPRLGWQHDEFLEFLNKAETDTAIETFANLKRKAQANGQKRPLDEDGGSASKRQKVTAYSGPSTRSSFSSSGSPISPANPQTSNVNGESSAYAPQQQDLLSFSALLDIPFAAATNSMLVPSMHASSAAGAVYASGSANAQREVFSGGLPSMDLRPRSQVTGLGAPLESSTLGLTTAPLPISPAPPAQSLHTASLDDDPRKADAFKLIHYHLDNYRRNPSYHLPLSLRPSLVQRTIPHDTVIDSIPLPELRDRMILLKGRFDLADCLFQFGSTSRVHEDDALSQHNWEIPEEWLRQFWFLVEQPILDITNRWRAKRGEPELTLADIGASEQIPASHESQ